ncbi:Glucose/ribitol dehydrogenase [Penicillium robsamsonii]|uniref:Glucose/ribitol dehydrogenase n=1 Tax=Penicillium robsamsonii TaxID=1792511 RepID=UPI0025483F4C|nr:Glucose/ribitol dehydrogenase [Penicillium robsamsonii]KAJ5823889.1 Glucose/ribitol dehydrogenase [Penicillium robsamsonii]
MCTDRKTWVQHRLAMDVTSNAGMELAFDKVVEDLGKVDNCITCAGVALDKPFLEHTWEESRRILDINVLGSFFSAQLAAKQMVKQGNGGSIVMIASIAAHCAIPAQRVSIYGASKGAIKLLGKTLAVEMAPFNIRVNTISPGFIATKMSAQFADLQEVFRTAPPMGRIGQPEDLALAVGYLLGDGASYTTGTDIAVTGGLHNGRIEF